MLDKTEIVFFDWENIKVTNARLMINEHTYAINNITSVKTEKQPSQLSFFFAAIIISLVILLAASYWVGGVLIIFSVWLLVHTIRNPTYSLMLRTASGENRALQTTNKEFMDNLVEALNDAIVHNA